MMGGAEFDGGVKFSFVYNWVKNYPLLCESCVFEQTVLFPLISSSITQSMDSGGTDNFILISQLKEEVMSLKRLLQQRDQTILEKDRKVGSLPLPGLSPVGPKLLTPCRGLTC